MTQAYKKIEKEIRDYIKVPEKIEQLSALATDDLYFGPVEPSGPYKGFQSAIKEIRDWADNLPYQLWVDSDSGAIWEREPETVEVEGEDVSSFWDSIYFVERKDILKALFDYELAVYL